MRAIIVAIVAILLSTALLGFWLQSAGVEADDEFVFGVGLPAMLWPLAFPLFGGLIALATVALNHKTIMRLWRADRMEKADMRPALSLLFGPVLALLMQAYVGLEHFELTTKARMMTGLAGLQLLFFFIVGNYAATLRAGSAGGFRTFWTVKSDQVWAKTHRFIGRGLFTVSVAGAAALFFLEPRMVIFGHIGAVIAVKLAAAAYSFTAWRAERHQHAL